MALMLLTPQLLLARSQCAGCEPAYVGEYDLGKRDAEYCFNANVPQDARSAFDAAVGDWVDGLPAWADAGLWCYPGSECDSNGVQSGGHGVLRLSSSYSWTSTTYRQAFAHDIGHTTGWDDIHDSSCSSIMYDPYSRFGLFDSDLCWYRDLWGMGDDGGTYPPPTLMHRAPDTLHLRVAGQQRKIMPTPPMHYLRPQSFGQMLRSEELVAVVRVVRRNYVQKGSFLLTHYEAELIEVLSSRGRQPSRTIDIYQHGGLVARSDGQTVDYRDPKFRRLSPDGVALVVLRWDPLYQGYGLPYGPNGTFEFLGQNARPGAMTVRTQGSHPDIAAKNEMPIGEFLAAARAAIRGGG